MNSSNNTMRQTSRFISDRKTILRSRARLNRDGISPESRFASTRSIQKRLTAESLLIPSQLVHSYVNIGSEVGTEELIRSMLRDGQRVACPRVVGKTKLEHIVIQDIDSLISSTLGLREPDLLNTHHADLAEVDVMLVPGLAFDRNGARLGYGRGYYDLALKKLREHRRAIVIGLAFDNQLVDKLPQDKHDQLVDLIVTEHQVISSQLR